MKIKPHFPGQNIHGTENEAAPIYPIGSMCDYEDENYRCMKGGDMFKGSSGNYFWLCKEHQTEEIFNLINK